MQTCGSDFSRFDGGGRSVCSSSFSCESVVHISTNLVLTSCRNFSSTSCLLTFSVQYIKYNLTA